MIRCSTSSYIGHLKFTRKNVTWKGFLSNCCFGKQNLDWIVQGYHQLCLGMNLPAAQVVAPQTVEHIQTRLETKLMFKTMSTIDLNKYFTLSETKIITLDNEEFKGRNTYPVLGDTVRFRECFWYQRAKHVTKNCHLAIGTKVRYQKQYLKQLGSWSSIYIASIFQDYYHMLCVLASTEGYETNTIQAANIFWKNTVKLPILKSMFVNLESFQYRVTNIVKQYYKL